MFVGEIVSTSTTSSCLIYGNGEYKQRAVGWGGMNVTWSNYRYIVKNP